MSTQAHLSREEVDNIRKKVSLQKHNAIPMQKTCGYKGINRTTLDDILYHLELFQFPEAAIRDVTNRLSLQSTIRSIAASAIRWDIDRDNAPTWSNCTYTQKARMLHELEERYPWMKQFHGQWIATVLLGKHVSSNSRGMHRTKVRHVATEKISPISRPTTGLSPVIISDSSSLLSTNESVDDENKRDEEEIGHAHDKYPNSIGEDDIGENNNEESDTGENAYYDGVEQEDSDEQPQIFSSLSKSRSGKD